MEQGIEKWAYSASEEGPYYNEFGDKAAAIAQGLAAYPEGCWVGRVVAPRPLSRGLYADELLEKFQEWLEEDWLVEWAHFEPTDEQVAQLQAMLRATLDDWFKRHGLEPKWFVVEAIEQVLPTQEAA